MHRMVETEAWQMYAAAGQNPQARQNPGLASVFLGGFECSTKMRPDGRRLDLIQATGHQDHHESDYRALLDHDIRSARDGLRWHLVEASPGAYDFSSFRPMLRAADACGLQVIWDLCHYGWPDWLDIWSPAFVDAFAALAAETARLVCEETGAPPFFCLINEMSYWAWAGGDVGQFGPCTLGRGHELKRQLVRASIRATAAVRHIAPGARFLHAEPLINVAPRSDSEEEILAAERYRMSQFEALDMLSGRIAPELGGHPDMVDLVGVNYYPDNQWVLGGGTIPLGHHAYRPLRAMLAEAAARFGRPLILAETGAEGTARPAWLHYVGDEVIAARRDGVAVEGICLYPVVDYPGWHDDRPCPVGLLSAPDDTGRRTANAEYAAELHRQQALLMQPRRERH